MKINAFTIEIRIFLMSFLFFYGITNFDYYEVIMICTLINQSSILIWIFGWNLKENSKYRCLVWLLSKTSLIIPRKVTICCHIIRDNLHRVIPRWSHSANKTLRKTKNYVDKEHQRSGEKETLWMAGEESARSKRMETIHCGLLNDRRHMRRTSGFETFLAAFRPQTIEMFNA